MTQIVTTLKISAGGAMTWSKEIIAIPVHHDDPGVQGFAIRCEQSQEETDSDIADFAQSFLSGDMTALDEDGEDIDPTTITPAMAQEFARREIEEGDWGRDGWSVSWVRWESPSDRPDFDRLTFVGDRADMTLFPSVETARAFIDSHMKDTTASLEIWGMV